MAPPDVIDVASRPVRAAERTPTLRRKKSFPKVKVNSSRMDFTAFILKGKREALTSTSLMTTKKIFPNSGPPFVKIIDQPLVAYVVVGIPTCSSLPPISKNPKVTFGCCRDALVTKYTSGAGKVDRGRPSPESAVCASHLLLGSAGRHGIFVQIYIAGRTCDGSYDPHREGLTFLTHIQSYRHGPTDLFSIGASSSATRFYLTKPSSANEQEKGCAKKQRLSKAAAPLLLALSYLVKQPFALGAHLFPKIEYLEVGKDPPLVSAPATDSASASGRSNGARLVSARRDIKNITNTGNKGIPDHICFCAMTISLELREPTHISTVYRGPRPEPHVQVSCMARPCPEALPVTQHGRGGGTAHFRVQSIVREE
ncbi:hypothetical protein HAX54_024759 [Datura stramonium]|uniref:Uncharacterized protein n=1 Tax=Datura stramonium TaxID=4076 RepID=A0ABS8S5P4_DATST|nr:hypothetical protein [Datura stramonium]